MTQDGERKGAVLLELFGQLDHALVADVVVPVDRHLAAIRADLEAFEQTPELEGLERLRAAAEQLACLIDETMASAVISGYYMRSVASAAGMTDNAIPPRLARTALLAGYADQGKVTASGVSRARYDREHNQAVTTQPPAPMRFKPRRNP